MTLSWGLRATKPFAEHAMKGHCLNSAYDFVLHEQQWGSRPLRANDGGMFTDTRSTFCSGYRQHIHPRLDLGAMGADDVRMVLPHVVAKLVARQEVNGKQVGLDAAMVAHVLPLQPRMLPLVQCQLLCCLLLLLLPCA